MKEPYCQESLKWAIELTKNSNDKMVQMLRAFVIDHVDKAPNVIWDVDSTVD